jgi:hypothetical protein
MRGGAVMTDRQMQALQVSVLILFALGFCAAMFGILVDRVNTTAFATITTITTGGIILLITSLAPPQFLRRVKIGPIEAELFELKKDLASQQQTINKLVIYSLVEIIYRELDRLLPHKGALEQHLRARLGELFGLDYDLLLYDVTSTYFEGDAAANPLAQRGYSRDHRPDCKQVNIALVVTREGLPLGYELFAGNRADVTRVKEIVESMELAMGWPAASG